MAARQPADPGTPAASTGLRREVGRWQLVPLSVNDVIGSGIYLLPAAAAALLGPLSLWAVLLAGIAVALLVLCYAQAASCFDRAGGGYLYAREAFGPFVGFEVGWMLLLTRIATAAALCNGLAEAVTHVWPAADTGAWRVAIVSGALALLVAVNVAGVGAAARTGVVLAIAKVVPLLLFIAVGAWAVDASVPPPLASTPPLRDIGQAALLLLFAYAGFENLPAAAGEFRNPRRDLPFALLSMIATVTAIYCGVQWVALGTLPGLADAQTPLADAAQRFSGGWLAGIVTLGAVVSIAGTLGNTIMLSPRYVHAMAADGFGPRALAAIHPRLRTPVPAIALIGGLSLVLALSGSFVQLALLSVVARLCAYIATALAVLVLRRRFAGREAMLRLPGGPVIPLLAALLSIGLLASASAKNLMAGGIALVLGAVVYGFRRKDTGNDAQH